jgi:hypothetical protein
MATDPAPQTLILDGPTTGRPLDPEAHMGSVRDAMVRRPLATYSSVTLAIILATSPLALVSPAGHTVVKLVSPMLVAAAFLPLIAGRLRAGGEASGSGRSLTDQPGAPRWRRTMDR